MGYSGHFIVMHLQHLIWAQIEEMVVVGVLHRRVIAKSKHLGMDWTEI